MRPIISLCIGFVAVVSAQDRNPTQEDLDITIQKWQRMVAPGQILKVKPKTVLIFNRSDLEKVQDAKKIGDDQGTIAELVKKDQAAITETEADVRLLDTFWDLCFAFSRLQMNCNDSIPSRLRNAFSELTAPPRAKRDFSPAQLDKFRGDILNHDLSTWVGNHYLQVRVVGGKQDATKGWIPMSEAQYPPEEKTR